MSTTFGEQKTRPPGTASTADFESPPPTFGEYELHREIARGGMGVVFKAWQPALNRFVALKMILSGNLASDNDVRRFRSEATAAASLRHPNIVPIYEVAETNGQHYFTMAFIDGESLASRVTRGPLPPQEAAGIISQIATAIHHAHTNKLVHRDIKPANILIDRDGHPFVTDFGLAKRIGSEGSTRHGEFMGTAGFLPPEQANGDVDSIDARSDVYALGATLYCLLTGNPPFHAASHIDTMFQVINREPVLLRRLDESIPADLETICARCLEKQPARRFQSALELSNELDRHLKGLPIHSRPISTTTRLIKWARLHRMQAVLTTVLLLTLITLSVSMSVYAVSVRRERERALSEKKRAEQMTEMLMDLVKRRLESKQDDTRDELIGPRFPVASP